LVVVRRLVFQRVLRARLVVRRAVRRVLTAIARSPCCGAL
jgi:hypothetical protein